MGTEGEAQPPAVDPPTVADLDRTMQDMKMPWAEGGDPSALGKDGGLEPISFDDLEELEELLRDDPRQKRKAAEGAESPPTPAKTEAHRKPSMVAFGTGEAFDDEPPPPPTAAAAPADSRTVWCLKSAAGLTYSFFDIPGLSRWAAGLEGLADLVVSIDGIVWKSYKEFQTAVDGGSGAIDAFRGTKASRPAAKPSAAAAAEPARPAAKGPGRTASATRKPTQARKRTRAGNRTSVSERQPPSDLADAMAAAVAQESGQSTGGKTGRHARPGRATGERARPAARNGGATKTGSFKLASGPPAEEINPWPGRLGFMGVGLFVGGAGVYFGMYLLGFYDLTFAF